MPVVDADHLAHSAVRRGAEALERVRRRFGDRAISADGEMDRRHVAEIVFRDDAARRDLEAIIHPVVRDGIQTFFNTLPAGTLFAVADIPLLYETGQAKEYEVVVVAACTPEMQIARVMGRDGSSREDAERRLRAQWPIEQKVVKADYVIRTDGSHEQTDQAVASVVSALQRRWS